MASPISVKKLNTVFWGGLYTNKNQSIEPVMEDRPRAKRTGPKACTTCAKAKARCVIASDAPKCERCARLNKPCSQQTPAPPRARKERRITRVARLEKKLEDLRSHLEEASHTPHSPTPTPEGIQKSEERRRWRLLGLRPVHDHLFPATSIEPRGSAPIVEDAEITSPIGAINASDTAARVDTDIWPDGEEAEKFLEDFRTKMMPLFPFVIVPRNIPSEKLRRERPFLWKAAMLEDCYTDGNRQIHLGRQLLRDLSEALLAKPCKDLDLLQGLLVFLSWYHFALDSFQVTNMLFLARSLCVSLGFNSNQIPTQAVDCSQHRLEEMRAFAGTYYLVTSVFTTSKRPDALMNTAYLNAICDSLEQNLEYPSDELLVRLVKIQQLAQSISSTAVTLQTTASVLPLSIFARPFQAQIDNFVASLPTHLQVNHILLSHIRIAELLLYEPALQDHRTLPSNTLHPTDRLSHLWSLLKACKAFLSIRFSDILNCKEPQFLCISSFDFMYAFITCLRLASVDATGWDLSVVQRDLGLGELVEKQARMLEAVMKRRNLERTEEDPFYRMVSMLKRLKGTLDALPEPKKFTQTTQVTQMPTPLSGDGEGSILQDWDLNDEGDLSSWQEVWSENFFRDMNDWGHGGGHEFGIPFC